MRYFKENKIIILLILGGIFITNCSYRQKKDLTNQVKLNYVMSENDSVQFLIKKIMLFDVINYNNITRFPDIALYISIKNKTNRTMYFDLYNDYVNYSFIGLVNKDTIGFMDIRSSPFTLAAQKDTIIDIWTYDPLYVLFDYQESDGADNTAGLLDLLQKIKFYYIPNITTLYPGQDSVVILKNTYPVGISDKTKIISDSEKRIL